MVWGLDVARVEGLRDVAKGESERAVVSAVATQVCLSAQGV